MFIWDPVTSLLTLYHEEIIRDTGKDTQGFPSMLLYNHKYWKHSECLIIGGWWNTLWSSCTIASYTDVKNHIPLHWLIPNQFVSMSCNANFACCLKVVLNTSLTTQISAGGENTCHDFRIEPIPLQTGIWPMLVDSLILRCGMRVGFLLETQTYLFLETRKHEVQSKRSPSFNHLRDALLQC